MLFPRKPAKSAKYTAEEQAVLIGRTIELLDALWRPARFLADLNAVWAGLSDEQRAEISESSVYKEKFHENRAQEMVRELQALVVELPPSCRDVRNDLIRYLRQWRQDEPDELKIFVGRLRGVKPRAANTDTPTSQE